MQISNKSWKNYLFTYRSYTPIPFLIVMVLFAEPTALSLSVGFVVAFAGEMIRFWGVSFAGSETRTTGMVGGTKLVTGGPYAFVRNPLYIGNIAMYLGVGIMSNALVPYLQLIALAYFIFQYTAIVSLEEEYLARTFMDWKNYSANVHRFIPGFKKFRGNDNLVPNFPRAVRSERSSLIALASLTLLLFAVYMYKNAA
ncbi:MAG: isoprenylcysteine carboxylmethyltransferase family protein [Candidatus Kryptoniota bacterium]